MLRKAAIIAALILTASAGAVAQSSDTALVFNNAGIDMNQNNITGLPTTGITSSGHAVSYGQATTDFVNENGDLMTGNLDMDSNNITNVDQLELTRTATSSNDAVNLGQADTRYVNENGDLMTGNLDMNNNELLNLGETSGHNVSGQIDMRNNKIVGVASPSNANDVATLSWATTEFVNEGGDGMTGILDMNTNNITNVDNIILDNGEGRITGVKQGSDSNDAINKGQADTDYVNEAGDGITGDMDHNSNDINNVGTLNANTKNFVQSVNDTHEAVYTAQESVQARAVIEGTVFVDGSETVELPTHFSQVASDSQPRLNVQVTPHTLTTVAATQTTTRYIKITSGDAATVDYRVTAVRDGYEDKTVVRQQ